MKQIKKILCPVDFSDPSEAALEAAVDLGGLYSAEIVLVHAINDIDPTPSPSYTLTPHLIEQIPQLMEQMKDNAHKALQALIDTYISGRLPVRDRVVVGAPARAIVRVATEEKADLIVIATHGRSGVQGLLFGSVAEKVVRTAECPVLTMKFESDQADDR